MIAALCGVHSYGVHSCVCSQDHQIILITEKNDDASSTGSQTVHFVRLLDERQVNCRRNVEKRLDAHCETGQSGLGKPIFKLMHTVPGAHPISIKQMEVLCFLRKSEDDLSRLPHTVRIATENAFQFQKHYTLAFAHN